MADPINRRFSWHSVADSIRSCVNRFPLSVLYVVALTAWAIILVWTDDYSTEWLRVRNVITYGFSTGVLLSLTVYLWNEGTGRKMASAGPQLIANLLLLADCVWLYLTYTTIGPAIILGHAAVLTTLGVCVFSGAFTNTRSDIPCWNFSHSLIMSAIVSGCIVIVMTMAISAIFATMRALLNFDESNWWISVWLTGALMIPVLIFMGRIPAGDTSTRSEANPSRFLTAVTKFLFVPTIMVFYGVLYVYLAKIITNWQLPEGMVCWPVTGAIVACFVIEYLLYPARMAAGAKARFENGVARWLPLTLIPLLGLMTVSLIHRVGEYGLTLSRLYMITLNAWAYVACVLLIITRARRFRWIPLTCAILFLLTSALPWANYANLTETVVRNELRSSLERLGVKTLPISQSDYNQITDKQPRDIRNLIEGKLRYLQNNFGEHAVAPVVIIDTKQQRYWSEWEAARDKNTDSEEDVEVICPRLDFRYDGDIAIPNGYSRMVPQRKTLWKLKPDSINEGRIWFNSAGYVFSINLDSLYNVSTDSISPVICIAEHNDSCAAVLVRICSYTDNSCDIDGFIFKK